MAKTWDGPGCDCRARFPGQDARLPQCAEELREAAASLGSRASWRRRAGAVHTLRAFALSGDGPDHANQALAAAAPYLRHRRWRVRAAARQVVTGAVSQHGEPLWQAVLRGVPLELLSPSVIPNASEPVKYSNLQGSCVDVEGTTVKEAMASGSSQRSAAPAAAVPVAAQHLPGTAADGAVLLGASARVRPSNPHRNALDPAGVAFGTARQVPDRGGEVATKAKATVSGASQPVEPRNLQDSRPGLVAPLLVAAQQRPDGTSSTEELVVSDASELGQPSELQGSASDPAIAALATAQQLLDRCGEGATAEEAMVAAAPEPATCSNLQGNSPDPAARAPLMVQQLLDEWCAEGATVEEARVSAASEPATCSNLQGNSPDPAARAPLTAQQLLDEGRGGTPMEEARVSGASGPGTCSNLQGRSPGPDAMAVFAARQLLDRGGESATAEEAAVDLLGRQGTSSDLHSYTLPRARSRHLTVKMAAIRASEQLLAAKAGPAPAGRKDWEATMQMLESALRDANGCVRWQAARCVRALRIPTQRGVPYYQRSFVRLVGIALADGCPRVRLTAARAIEEMLDDDAESRMGGGILEPLKRHLRSKDLQVRWQVLESFCCGAAATPDWGLFFAAASSVTDVADAAWCRMARERLLEEDFSKLFGDFGRRSCAGRLGRAVTRMLCDEDGEIREGARLVATACRKAGLRGATEALFKTDVPALQDITHWILNGGHKLPSLFGERILMDEAELLACLDDVEWRTRDYAVEALAAQVAGGSHATAGAMAQLLVGRPPEHLQHVAAVRLAAVEVLSHLSSKSNGKGAAVLVTCLQQPALQAAAAHALARAAKQGAVPQAVVDTLASVAEDAYTEAERYWAHRALVDVTEANRQLLVESLKKSRRFSDVVRESLDA